MVTMRGSASTRHGYGIGAGDDLRWSSLPNCPLPIKDTFEWQPRPQSNQGRHPAQQPPLVEREEHPTFLPVRQVVAPPPLVKKGHFLNQ